MYKLQVKKNRNVMRWENGHPVEGIPAVFWETTDVAETAEELEDVMARKAHAGYGEMRIVEGKKNGC